VHGLENPQRRYLIKGNVMRIQELMQKLSHIREVHGNIECKVITEDHFQYHTAVENVFLYAPKDESEPFVIFNP
jgi:predicted metallo-beta-lactamase superfamily hydrolase